jgi:peptidoglycan/xylan/chitin deacetylase (PgdA/CDA1 family)
MQRRSFIKATSVGSLAFVFVRYHSKNKSHILTLSFDDGMKKSFHQIADIFEGNGLQACLNVIASGHLQSFRPPNEYHLDERGDFNDWNSLQKRGHEIMPHSWDHANLAEMPLEQAKEDVIRCLDYFEGHLDRFKASDAVYNFAFNASTPDLEQFVLSTVRAVRTHGDKALNPFPLSTKPVRLGCLSYGPDNADKWVETMVNEFLVSSGSWLILNLHGLDREGWGPVSSQFLNDLLKRLVRLDYLDILPTGAVLKRVPEYNS